MTMLLLFLTGLFAGTVDAIAGGGGLITIPVLLGIGLPPHVAFGTNKLQGAIGTSMAARRFWREGWISVAGIYRGVVAGLLGAIAGAVTNQLLDGSFLAHIVPVMLLIIFLYTVLSPNFGSQENAPKLNGWFFYLVFGFILGFYDGFFGPGTGAFWVFLLTFFLGFNLIKATAYTKVFNLNSSLIAVFCFAIGSNINYKVGLCMAAGQIIGGWLGAHLAVKQGVRLIRPLFLTMVLMTILSMLYRNYGAVFFHLVRDNFSRNDVVSLAIGLISVCLVLVIRRLLHRNNDTDFINT